MPLPVTKLLRSFLSRSAGLLWRRKEVVSSDTEDDDNEGGSRTPPSVAAAECYACTQPGAPAFHSTTCDRAHSPEWEASAGSSLIPIRPSQTNVLRSLRPGKSGASLLGGQVLDPRSEKVRRWNRLILLARAVAVAVDPLFFYVLSIGRRGAPCLYMDGGLLAIVTALRTAADAVHLVHVWLQFRVAYVSRESLVVGCGKLVWDARVIAAHYLRSLRGFWFDVFVILPVPQAVFWLVVPKLIKEDKIKLMMTILLLIFVFQFLPKVYHSICVMRRMQKVTGYIFGTIWWGFGLNLIAYFIASHVAGGCWYVLAIQRVASCLQQQCEQKNDCDLVSLACSKEVCYSFTLRSRKDTSACEGSLMASTGMQNTSVCLTGNGPFPYGIYNWALPVVSSSSLAVKILYPIFWGLMTLSTFGNDLEPTSHWLEVIFSIVIVLSGLMLFTLLIGNIQVFLHAVMARKRKMQLRSRDMEWWMKRRQLPSRLRQRVRQYERQRWAATRGEEEMEMIKDFPEGLRRDIKRYLCVDLIKQVPLFHNLDDLILDNICERVKPHVFSKGEKVIREGDPVQRMVFVVRGHLKSSQCLSKGTVATCMLGPGNFLGDELLSWCLRRPFVDRLPASSATFECVEPAEAFGLDAPDLRYITEHFRYKFANERLKRTARFYSSNWRTWAAVNIQLAWRRYKTRTGGAANGPPEQRDGERRLRMYAAMFMSLRPQDHLE
ncbi:26S proteasome non-ATPase regulatory subunit [Musa troglodytarum]|uniref:26S proteasome non-ATPase regulatory subunit n=1 Tax=Musa troglodytarum TaxID=320322 RepID=A0A9E7KZH8_9LILI|nr:26S proteasome non-ATPase regulatory subunit [Musa troglodytarum]URE35051.1 26S proteasome non-ATPase regulatory subunit [Musa troglodytarum]